MKLIDSPLPVSQTGWHMPTDLKFLDRSRKQAVRPLAPRLIGALALLAILAAMTACSSDPPRTEVKEGVHLSDLFRELQGRRVSLNRQEGADTVSVFLQEDRGDWSICGVGADFARFCHEKREDTMVFPLTDLHLIDASSPASD